MSDLRRLFKGLLVPAASVALLAVGCCGSVSWAASMFVGVTGIETRALAGNNTQAIEFQSDLPFQYQMQVLDKNRVVLRLYNARIASNLITPEGGINLLAAGAVQSAMLNGVSTKTRQTDEYQEIIFTGPNLGLKNIRVVGPTELTFLPSSAKAMLAVVNEAPAKQAGAGKSPSPQAKPAFKTPAARIEIDETSTNSNNKQNTKPDTKATVPVRFMDMEESRAQESITPATFRPSASQAGNMRIKIDSSGPQIESVTNSPSLPPAYQRKPSVMAGPAYQVQQDSQRIRAESTVSTQVNSMPSSGVVQPAAPPEPGYQVVMAMPRYQGGAAPIQAVTLDERGKPVIIHPKNAPIADDAVASISGPFNNLFQAESDQLDEAGQVGSLMESALSYYKQNRFDQALIQVQQALRLDADNADLHAALGEIQLKLNQPALATQAFQKAADLAPSKYGQRYAEALVSAGKKTEAVQVLEKLYRQDSKQAQVAYMLGTLHEEMGHTPQALSFLKQAAQLHPASADIQYNLGLAYELTGDREQAERHYRQALTLNPGAKDIGKALQRVRD